MEREKEAFIEWLYTQYAVKLERASLNWVQHRPEYRDMVDDSIQKTFLKACEEYDRLKDAPYIEAWLFKTCRHRLLTEINTYRRRQKRHVALDGGTAVSDERLMTAIDALPEQIGNRETLERILNALSEREKGLVRERFVNGASFEEMAQKEKTTVGAIRSALAAVLAFGGTATVLGLSGSDHTKRLEELQQNRMVEAADTVSADTKLVALPIDGGTLTLAQADEKKIADEEGKILIAAQTLTDVDGEDGVRMLLALIESAEEVHVQSAYLVGFDADGKQMESAAEASVSPVLLADRQSVVIAEIEPHAMDGAERFELRLNIEREPKCAAEEQDADAELRDHYFVATLTEDAEDGEEANGYVSIWATDAEGTLLDGFNASLAEGEQLLAGETWTFEKRIGSWVTPEQEDTIETGSVGYRLIR